MKKIVCMTAYAVNPYKGSEDGMGWNFACEMSRYFKVIVITRKNNLQHIQAYMQANPQGHFENLTFIGFDLPYILRFWKRKQFGALLYYYLWQRSMPGFIRKKGLDFDLLHNLNFHNDWTPSFLWKLKAPLVWGPIGHHNLIPADCLKNYGVREQLKNQTSMWVKKLFWNRSRDLKRTARKSAAIIAMNQGVGNIFPEQMDKMFIEPSVGTHKPIPENLERKSFVVLSVGRFVALKGFDLTLKGFGYFYRRLNYEERKHVKLRLIGRGPALKRMQKWIAEEELSGAVEIVPWVEKEELSTHYYSASVFLFPSHEGAGMVVAEALAHQLPVICLDNEGPGEFIDEHCGYGVKKDDLSLVPQAIANHLFEMYSKPHKWRKLSHGAYSRFEELFDWRVKGLRVKAIYEEILGIRPGENMTLPEEAYEYEAEKA